MTQTKRFIKERESARQPNKIGSLKKVNIRGCKYTTSESGWCTSRLHRGGDKNLRASNVTLETINGELAEKTASFKKFARQERKKRERTVTECCRYKQGEMGVNLEGKSEVFEKTIVRGESEKGVGCFPLQNPSPRKTSESPCGRPTKKRGEERRDPSGGNN